MDYVIQQLERKYGERAFTGGFQVYTTLDLAEQEQAEKARRGDAEGDTQARRARSSPSSPRTGKVRAMVGRRRTTRKSQFNIATSGQRQPGSAFKPFVLLAGLEDGIQTATHFTSRQAALRPRQPPGLVRHQLHEDVRGLDRAAGRHDRRRTTPSTRS